MKTTPMPVTRTMMEIPALHQPTLLTPTYGGSTVDISRAQAAMSDGYGKACGLDCSYAMPATGK